MPIVLASASPRRQQLLKEAGVDFVLDPPNIAEIEKDEAPEEFAQRMAREKARAVRGRHPREPVLAADTVVVHQETVLGKPRDEQDAERMLRRLRGSLHQVITAVCLAGPGYEDVRSAKSNVRFGWITDQEIRDYIQSGEPMDKAGAYAIQGIAGRWIRRVEGDYSNVVGLPVELVLEILRQHGVIPAS
jgi:septum formation protein